MTGAEWAGIITPITTMAGIAISGYIALKMKQVGENTKDAAQSATDAAVKVQQVAVAAQGAAAKVVEVKDALAATAAAADRKMDEIARVGNDTHTLVNSNMGVQLKLNAALSRRMADITKNPDDEKAAQLAELAYDEHVKKQAVVDSGGKTA